jgi:hypothetical protein
VGGGILGGVVFAEAVDELFDVELAGLDGLEGFGGEDGAVDGLVVVEMGELLFLVGWGLSLHLLLISL